MDITFYINENVLIAVYIILYMIGMFITSCVCAYKDWGQDGGIIMYVLFWPAFALFALPVILILKVLAMVFLEIPMKLFGRNQ